MKYKTMIKIITVLLPFFFFSKIVDAKVDPNGPYCYYTSQNGLYLKIHQNDIHVAYVDKAGYRLYGSAHEDIINATGNGYCWISKNSCSFMETSEFIVPKWNHQGNKCPQYVIMLRGKPGTINTQHYVYASDKVNDINLIAQHCTETDNAKGGLLIDSYSCTYYKAEYKPNMTKEEYEQNLKVSVDNLTIDSPADWETKEDCSIFGDVKDSGWSTVDTLTGKTIEHQPSLAYVIHQVMSIIRIIVIVLMIVLGMLDFGKAALAGKEDEMKKSQKTFVRRLIICVVIFLIPTFIDIIMKLANQLIETETCTDILNNL